MEIDTETPEISQTRKDGEGVDFTEFLATKMMLKIIKYLEPNKDHLAINKRFNTILSETRSFMDQFQIVWKDVEKKDVGAILASNKAYTTIQISNINVIPPELITVLQQHPIELLNIENCRITSNEFQQILEAVAMSVDTISLGRLAITDNAPISEIKQIKFESFIWLEALNCENLRFVKQLMGADQLYHVNFEDNGSSEVEVDMVAQFLANQKKLKILYLTEDMAGIYNREELVGAMNFQLYNFIVEGNHIEGERLRNFQTFLRKQDSLSHLSAQNMNLDFETTRIIINELKSLDYVSFHSSTLQSTHAYQRLKKNLIIEKISFSYVDDESCMNIMELLQYLPNLKLIYLSDFRRTPLTGILRTLAENAPDLETIKFFNCHIPSIELKQVQELEFHKCTEKYVQEFLKVNPHVEESDVKIVAQ
jgi:hypothetical protein